MVGSGDEISLHLRKESILKYMRDGDDLQLFLVDGRTITLTHFYDNAAAPPRLYLSSDGEISEVVLQDSGDGVIFAEYSGIDTWGEKWSPVDQLTFLGDDQIAGPPGDEEATGMAMFAPALLGLGPAGLLAAGAVGAGVIGGGGGGGGGGGSTVIVPTVDNPDDSHTIITTTLDPEIEVTGTGEPGSSVVVTVGDVTTTTTVGDDGTWGAVIPATDLPPDGSYSSVVEVTAPDGTVYPLDGPDYVIDMTPPDVAVSTGTVAVGDIENAAEFVDGVTITGTGEVGAAISVEVEGVTRTTTVGDDGTWSVTFEPGTLAEGEYTSVVTVTATDLLGNTTELSDVLAIDTVADPIAFDAVTGDDLVNAAEAAAGVTVTGTSTPGATLTLTLEGVTQDVVVADDGSWSASWAVADLPAGTYDTTLTATTTDAAGNVSTETHVIHVDTETAVAFDAGAIAGDDIVNATEAAGGLVLTGTAEAGASVEVTIGTVTRTATVAADGSWSATFEAGSLASGTYTATAIVTATDAAGNVASATRSFAVDTDGSVTIDAVTGDNVISGAERSAGFAVTGTAEAGASVEVALGGTTQTVTADGNGNWSASFNASNLASGEYPATATATTTDASGNVSVASQAVDVDTETTVAFSGAAIAGNDVVNGAEAGQDLVLTGTAEPGATVNVTIGSVTRPATVAADGSWSATFEAGTIAAGTYTATATVEATDAVGNVASDTRSFSVDTVANVTVNPVTADNTVSGTEAPASLAVTGTADAGATVEVTMGAITRSATADMNGTWTVSFPAGVVAAGEYAASLSVSATDTNGNTATLTHAFDVDTVTSLTAGTATPGADDVVNAAEAAGGLAVSGTGEPGATVEVALSNGATASATVDFNGNWSTTIPASALPSTTTTLTMTTTATDLLGNVAQTAQQLAFDPEVEDFALTGTVGGDGTVNIAEADAGFAISGQVEAGSEVVVTLANGATRTVTSDQNGDWAANFDASDLPAGEGSLTYDVVATDAAGNSDTLSGSFAYDQVAPDAPQIEGYMANSQGLTGITTDTGEVPHEMVAVAADGSSHAVSYGAALPVGADETLYVFDQGVPNGSYLVVNALDAAGNDAASLVIVDNTAAVSVDLDRAGLAGYDFGAIDLSFAPQADLTITEAQINALTDENNTLVVSGDGQDTVTATGAHDTGLSTMIGGVSHHIYTLGTDGTTLIVDDNVTVVI
ncbi:Ig-like domain-containing protein [Phaeovulum vinaykumarii]|nr:Ig-like domain-containing protein [Phaeovulum vinaykumarii]